MAPGRVSAQMVLIIFSLLMTIYRGICPPLKYMVKAKNQAKTVRAWNLLLLLERG